MGDRASAAPADTDSVARPGPAARADTDSVALPARAVPADTDSVAGVRADSARPDTLDRDSTLTVPDSLTADSAALRDSLPPTLDDRRQALSGGDFPERDEIFNQLVELSGYRVVEYRGREVELDVDREAVELRGEAQANYTGSVLEADSLTYLAGLQFIEARGNIRLQSEGVDEVISDSLLRYDVSQFKGTIFDARTTFSEQGATWFVRGDATPYHDNTVFVEPGLFTSCEFDVPHYQFRAGQIKVITERVIVAWPVVLEVQGVPIAWLPFFAQDIRQGRRSGFLPPRFGFNDILGTGNFNRQISDFGYYFAISPYLDAQATVDWFSGRYTRLNGAFRYKSLKRFLQGSVLASYNVSGDENFELRVNHDQQLSPVTDFRVRAAFVQNTRTFQNQTFDPRLQTQNIESDVGFNHRFPFANISLSARAKQFLGDQTGRTDLTLPQLNVSFSPVTIFPAPRTRAGAFNNMVLSGALNFSRIGTLMDEAEDRLDTRAGTNLSFRVGNFNISGTASGFSQKTTPFDSLGNPPPAFSRTTVNYSTSANYQIDLIGSTTLRPTVGITGASFRSPDTGEEFISAPTRFAFGATLSTDVFGFLPGFGAFARIRHKISPRFTWAYAPEATVDDSLLDIPGFPASSSRAQNRLSIALNQTFEGKVREDRMEEIIAVADSVAEADSTLIDQPFFGEPGQAGRPAAGIAEQPRTTLSTEQRGGGPVVANTGAAPARQTARERNIVLLSINSSPLEFDFTLEDQPKLTTDLWRHSLNSDMLRGLTLNLSLDMFEGFGEERELKPILADLTASFTFSSSRGVGGIFGVGGVRAGPSIVDPGPRIHQQVDSRYGLMGFDDRNRIQDDFGQAGPWTLSLGYSLRRLREDEQGTERQSILATLALLPTPNWRLQWRTQYDLTNGKFGEHLVTLDRDLHRWQASFVFSRAVNGNFLFTVRVNLRDAPDLKLDYDQQTLRD